MTWVLWRQYRTTALVIGGLLILIIAFLLISGFHGISVAQELRLASCAHQETETCSRIIGDFYNRLFVEQLVAVLVLFLLPLLGGLFVGSPLIAREWEQGTYRLAWTQSVTRSRWLANRLTVLILAILLISIIPAALAFWWSGPYSILSSVWTNFDFKGLVPVAYALFAFALGAAGGTLLRKTIPAMGVTLLLFLVIRIAIAIWLRPHFLPPLTTGLLDTSQSLPPQTQQGETVQYQYVDRLGHPISINDAIQPCAYKNIDFNQCMHDQGIRYYILYHPADRFWLFQGMEAALYIVLTIALLSLMVWLVRKRLC
jgi:hypothetical protein